MNTNISQEHIQVICEKLLKNQNFIKNVTQALANQPSLPNIELNKLIEEVSELLDRLIHQKIEKQMCDLIDDNNRILQQINNNIIKNNSSIQDKNIQNKHDASFSDIHKLINEEKKKALDNMNDAEFQKSISVMQKYEQKYGDIAQKIIHLSGKVRSMEDKYESGFKSLWNVLSMTEEAFFDHIRQHKQSREKQNSLDSSTKQNSHKNQPFFKFWK